MGAGLRALTALLVLISVPHQLTAQPQVHGGAERKLQQGDHLYDPQALFTEEKQKEEEPAYEVIISSTDSYDEQNPLGYANTLARLAEFRSGHSPPPSPQSPPAYTLPNPLPSIGSRLVSRIRALVKRWSPAERKERQELLRAKVEAEQAQLRVQQMEREAQKRREDELDIKKRRREERAQKQKQREDAAQKAADEQKAAEEAAAKAKLDDKDAAVQRELRAQGTKLLEERERLQATLAGPTFQRMFEEARHKGMGTGPGKRRGIMIPSGGTTLINHAYATVKVLRETLRCRLPIEVIYNGKYEMDAPACAHFERDFRGVRCIDASTRSWYPRHHKPVQLGHREGEGAKGAQADREGQKDVRGFQFKVFALCYITSFDEVLMLDSDNLPLRDPEYLFRTPEYRGGGSLFFSDWWDIVEWVKPEAYTAFGLDFPGYKMYALAAESGQVLLDRSEHADVLEWLWFLNSHPETIYKLMYGDKDTFRLAFALAGKESAYHQIAIPPSCPLDASPSNGEPVGYLHAGMVQHDPQGSPAFLHRTAEGKVYPFNHGYRRADYLTVPLSSRRAAGVLGHDFKKMGFRTDQVDHDTYAACPVTSPQRFHLECGLSLRSGAYPVPVMPVRDMPDLAHVLNASYAAFDALQQAFQTTFVLG